MGGDTPRRAPTSFDVARAAGVSRSTVSRAFTEGARISPAVRARVLAAADALGYRVNALARGLQSRHSSLVGIVASRLDTPFRAVQVRCLAQGLLREGMTPLLLVADGGEDVRALIQNILGYNLAGVIVTSDTPPPEVLQACNRAQVPVVMINRGPAAAGADTVNLDLAAAGRAAFEMLRDSGARRFGVLAPAVRTYSVTGRAAAFETCCRAEGYPVAAFHAAGQSFAAGRDAADDMAARARAEGIEGIFCATDLLALGALDRLRHGRGIDIPGAFQMVGFDDIDMAGWHAYDLSTIRQDVAAQAGAAVGLVLTRLARPERACETLTFGVTKVPRTTTRRAALPPGNAHATAGETQP